MNKYRVLFCREQVLAHKEVEAKNKDGAIKKAYKYIHKYDVDDTEYEKVELLEKIDER